MQPLSFTVKGFHREVDSVLWTQGSLPAQSHPGLLPATEFYVYQRRSDCFEFNGTHHFLEQYVYNREVYVHFDSTVGVFVAVTELGRITAKNWNIQREFLELRKSAVVTVCRHNYELDKGFTLMRRGEWVKGKEKILRQVGLGSRGEERSLYGL